MKICLISDLHLINNPRVWKEAKLLSDEGYEISILTIWTSAERRDKDLKLLEGYPIKYIAPINLIKGEISFIQRFFHRAILKFSKLLMQFLKIETKWLIGFSPDLMLKKALEEKADLYIAHTEYGMYIGNELIKKSKKVAYDYEDWYSQDYLVASRPVKFLRTIEKFALQHGAFCICPSLAMAKAIQGDTDCSNEIIPVYNGFSITEKKTTIGNSEKIPNSLIWFSQTIGPGRGLEELIESLNFLSNVIELHLLGSVDEMYKNKLMSAFPSKHKLVFHEPVSHKDLLGILSKFTIGLALESRYPESRNTTITNKILQYVQAGIKVLATDTLGQREVASFFPELVEIVPQNTPERWAKAIEQLLSSDSVDEVAIDEKFKNIFSLEAQQKKILSLVSKTLNS
ncbi:hypothetical protein ACQ33O_10020 [Ferruginibacter sp. SUN002]|uniref:hypothetical protein n=1 Tax=Ferruginibacter sp. SUN002 TaxID=2937789 RepID=UPI003D363415